MNIEREALLCGIMIGDGCLSKYKSGGSSKYEIVITMDATTDAEFSERVMKLLQEINQRTKVRKKIRKDRNAVLIQTYSKELIEYMNKEWQFPIGEKGQIKIVDKFANDEKLMKKVISGLIATDGTVIFSKQQKNKRYYPRIELATKSNKMAKQVSIFFKNGGYKYSKWQNKDGINRLSIHGFASTMKFNKEVGLINPKHKNKFENGINGRLA